ncbi:MAG TPA: Hsp20/alpha crystallin family protein [Candidatus Nanoarchaeia archaeon]|nr:Hsp20/alpha crystallin family protein [Candidatus Nanoarchaeia archaeon]
MGKRSKKGLAFLEETDLNKFVKIVRNNVNALRKALGQFEEPYSEMSQNFKEILIKVTLPDVERRYLTLKMVGKTIEIVADQKYKGKHLKTFYRSIALPSTADIMGASAKYISDTLYIKVPQTFIHE